MVLKVVPYPTTVLFNVEGVDIIGNSETGSMIGLTNEGIHLVKKIFEGTPITLEDLSLNEKKLLKALFEYNMVHDGSIHFEDKIEIHSAYLHVTNNCNLNCIGCYSRDKGRNKLKDLSLNTIKQIIEQLKKYSLRNLILSGGEPFLRHDLDEIVRYAKEEVKIEKIFILTNGTIADKNLLYNIKPYIDNISVSIDGFNKENPTYLRDPGIFDKVMRTINLIKSTGIQVSILPTLHKKNIYNIKEYVKLAKELGVGLSFSLFVCNSFDANECKDLNLIPSSNELVYLGRYMSGKDENNDISLENLSIQVRKTCEAGRKLISIAANGNVYPCHILHNENFLFGNIVDRPLKDVLNSPNAKLFRSLSVDNFEGCKECRYRYLCGGGCKANAFYNSGNLLYRDYYCDMYNEYYKNIVNIFKDLKNKNHT